MNTHSYDHVVLQPAFALDPAAFARSSQQWLHHAPGRGPWIDDIETEAFRAPANLLVRWLAEQGPSLQAELRIGTTGLSAGVWLGFRGVGATPAQADHLGRKSARTLRESMEGFRWKVRSACPPRLPRRRLCLAAAAPSRRFHSPPHKLLCLPIMGRTALPGAPLLLRVRIRFRQSQPELIRAAGEARELASAHHDPGNEQHSLFAPSRPGDSEVLLSRADRLLDRACRLQLCLSLHATRMPAELPLRLLAGAFTHDLEAAVRWQKTAAWVPADLELLTDFVHLLSASAEALQRCRHDYEDMPF